MGRVEVFYASLEPPGPLLDFCADSVLEKCVMQKDLQIKKANCLATFGGAACGQTTQRLQKPVIDEHTLNHIKKPCMI